MKSGVVATITVISLAAVAFAAFGRYRTASSVSTTTQPVNVIATVNIGSEPDSVVDLVADVFLPATSAPKAPEFAEGTWINSDALSLEKLRGHVALVEFWTFGCYNCRNTLPSVKNWDAKYRAQGLTIVGVHTPETSEEHNLESLRREVPSLGIKYPVVTDNDYKTWKAYNVAAWPTMFVLDKQGRVRWLHVGEGMYEETEGVIKTLLAE